VADPGPLARPLYAPSHARGPVADGSDVEGLKRTLARAGFWEWKPPFDGVYSEEFALGGAGGEGVRGFQLANGLNASGNYGRGTHDKLRMKRVPEGRRNAGQQVWDAVAASLYRSYTPVNVPDLGPVVSGGRPMLNHDLTHITGGLPDYPAFDDGFVAGVGVIAPEDLEVTRHSSARRRDGNPNGKALYATGKSGLLYWFGHIEDMVPVGARLSKGERLGVISANHEAPHVHVGVDARGLLGKQFVSHDDYTHGGPTIGSQLETAE
jgi:hypothetical protein